MRRTASGLCAVWALLAAASCGDDAPDRFELAQELAPTVRGLDAVGEYTLYDDEPAITLGPLGSPQAGAVLILSGSAVPGTAEQECPDLNLRLAPFGPRGPEAVPLVAAAVEDEHGVDCEAP